jgi:predicted GNAT family N-acyltransferase
MDAKRDLKFVLCIAEEAIERRFQSLICDLIGGNELASKVPSYRFTMAHCETREQATNCARQHLADNEHHAAILNFDLRNEREAVDWVKEVHGEIKANCATIAIMEPPRRLPDIDRVIGRTADSVRMLGVLKLVTDKLTYTASPSKRTIPSPPVEVRLIRRRRELMDYFRLRHRVYKVMGYLEERIENTPSQMEIDWCDEIALHFGAFAGERKEQLVGTARVVVNSAAEADKKQPMLSRYREWVIALLEPDPVLKRSVNKGVLPLELPIFHSQKLSTRLGEVLLCEEACAELSRVIVEEDYRGVGLSTRLVEFALEESARVGVNRVFLECLALHETLYRKLGFQRIPGDPGNVIGVNQTMIGMEKQLGAYYVTAGD